MKSYAECISEISADYLFEGFLAHGLFADKIPEFLTSEEFCSYYLSNIDTFQKNRSHDFIRYESIRHTNVPRQLGVPNPFSYAELCLHLKQNWSYLKKYFDAKTNNNEYKISRIHIRKLKETNSIFKMNYENFSDDGEPSNDLCIKSNYTAHADISNCFPSVYSHSIPWALVTKKIAKQHRSAQCLKKHWFNILDFKSRNLKNGETNGLLIGPHTSNFLSEIVLVKIDSKLSKKYRYIRHIDDYTCYVDDYKTAENFLADLSIELRKYDLKLNDKKSKIKKLPFSISENWIRRLKSFYFPDSKVMPSFKYLLPYKFLRSYLDLAVHLMSEENDNSAILNYAIKVISKKELGEHAKQYYIKRIHHLVLVYPYLARQLEEYVFDAFSYNKIEIEGIVLDLFNKGLENKLFEPLSYSLYFAIKYNIDLKLTCNLPKVSTEMNDCILLLLSYLYDKKNNNPVDHYILEAEKLNELDFDRFWLFVYEVLPASKISNSNFKNIKRNNISFVKNSFC